MSDEIPVEDTIRSIGDAGRIDGVLPDVFELRKYSGIQTVYRGIEFRSRLEARWAAFFDQCEWPWVYEGNDILDSPR